jgi:hypothetical protein
MSQTSQPAERDGESSVQRMDVEPPSEEKQRRAHDENRRVRTTLVELTEQHSTSDATESLSKEDRIEKAEELMAKNESVDLDLSVGELVKVSPELIIERTESGFNSYIVVE